MRTIQDIKLGEKFNHGEKGDGVVIDKTRRTITIKYERSTCKCTYKYNDAYFHISDF
ncbi:hypothetical protein Nekkels1_75 [Cellulophaga phage Nekkels_1]|uniref:Uncharacterized protein n=1 Tax=Cellulophaga phage Nekkels_1 TaxID=2745692 RepID=A0A8E4XZM9_9CAUD|nr:hypothetical protein M1M31_gp75 [Cellulophaga phage Nekkels_1]QQO97080.1 hypothetical protein Nekkels1_75 [Cellulophaga phage Nekkels_1]